jgi:hypothetical protein
MAHHASLQRRNMPHCSGAGRDVKSTLKHFQSCFTHKGGATSSNSSSGNTTGDSSNVGELALVNRVLETADAVVADWKKKVRDEIRAEMRADHAAKVAVARGQVSSSSGDSSSSVSESSVHKKRPRGGAGGNTKAQTAAGPVVDTVVGHQCGSLKSLTRYTGPQPE